MAIGMIVLGLKRM